MKKFILFALALLVSLNGSSQKKDTVLVDATNLSTELLTFGSRMYLVYSRSESSPHLEYPTCVRIDLEKERLDGKQWIVAKQVWQMDTVIHTSLTRFEGDHLRTVHHTSWWKRKGYTEHLDFKTRQASFEGKIADERKSEITESVQALLTSDFLNWHSDLIIFPLLAFKENRVFRINFYEPGFAAPNEELYEVLGSESIVIAGTPVDCWVLNYKVVKPAGYQRFWISKASSELLKEEDKFGSFSRYKLKLVVTE